MTVTEINPKDVNVDEKDYGHIFIRFVSPGSVFFDFDLGGIVPLQMIVIGEYFLTLGKSQLLKEQAEAQHDSSREQIEIPRPNIDPGALMRNLKR